MPVTFRAGTTFYHGTKADLAVGDLHPPRLRQQFRRAGAEAYLFLRDARCGDLGRGAGAREKGAGASTSSSRPAHSRTTPTSPTRNSPATSTASYRSLDPLRIVGEVEEWAGHPPEQLQQMRDNLARMKAHGTDTIIED